MCVVGNWAEATTWQCQGYRRVGGMSRSEPTGHLLGTGHRGQNWAMTKKLLSKFSAPQATPRNQPVLMPWG